MPLAAKCWTIHEAVRTKTPNSIFPPFLLWQRAMLLRYEMPIQYDQIEFQDIEELYP